MKIVSWNVNGIRSCWGKGLQDFLQENRPDVITFQEVKSQLERLPEEIRNPADYTAIWHPGGRPGYSGVAAFVRSDSVQPVWHLLGIGVPEFDAEGRVITLEFEDFFLVSAYFPNSGAGGRRVEFKNLFCRKMETFCSHLLGRGKGVILTGDFNIGPLDIDVHPADRSCGSSGLLPSERSWMNDLCQKGWVDVFRRDHPDAQECYSWWSFFDQDREHNRGWRIDHVLSSAELAPRLKVQILSDVMGSDHCPVMAILS